MGETKLPEEEMVASLVQALVECQPVAPILWTNAATGEGVTAHVQVASVALNVNFVPQLRSEWTASLHFERGELLHGLFVPGAVIQTILEFVSREAPESVTLQVALEMDQPLRGFVVHRRPEFVELGYAVQVSRVDENSIAVTVGRSGPSEPADNSGKGNSDG